MTALHHPTEDTGLTLDELAAELDAIDAKRKAADRLYLLESAADYQRHLARVFSPYRGDPDLIPDPCPACDGAGYFEDEEGFATECNVCRPENPEPWIIPAPRKDR